jgi:hypothetical protein
LGFFLGYAFIVIKNGLGYILGDLPISQTHLVTLLLSSPQLSNGARSNAESQIVEYPNVKKLLEISKSSDPP